MEKSQMLKQQNNSMYFVLLFSEKLKEAQGQI